MNDAVLTSWDFLHSIVQRWIWVEVEIRLKTTISILKWSLIQFKIKCAEHKNKLIKHGLIEIQLIYYSRTEKMDWSQCL